MIEYVSASASAISLPWEAIAGAIAIFITALAAGWKSVRNEQERLEKGKLQLTSPPPILIDSQQLHKLVDVVEANTRAMKAQEQEIHTLNHQLTRLCDLMVLRMNSP